MKWIKAVRVSLALALLSIGTVQLSAARTSQYERHYFTDASFSEQCGGALVFCDGAEYWGCYDSPYYVHDELPSCTTPGDNPNDPPGGQLGYPENCSCKDGFDNDHDGKVDMDDPSCAAWPWCNES